MNKQNYLYGIIGVLVGFIIGFFGTNHINQSAPSTSPAVASNSEAELPPNHPPTSGSGSTAPDSAGAPRSDVMEAIERARKEPSNFEAQIKAADLFKQIGSKEETLEFYERAIKVKPRDFNLLTTLGNTNFDLKRYEEAEKWYHLALKVNPNNAAVWMDLGSSYYFREPRNLDKAIAAYRAALKADPQHEMSLQSLTGVLIEKGDKSAARESFKQLEQKYPNNSFIPQFRSELP